MGGVSPINCTDDANHVAGVKDAVRCPRCGQFHLRAGYCQALRRRQKVQEAVSVDDPVDTFVDNVDTPVDSVVDADTAERRRAYKREWMRKKREQEG